MELLLPHADDVSGDGVDRNGGFLEFEYGLARKPAAQHHPPDRRVRLGSQFGCDTLRLEQHLPAGHRDRLFLADLRLRDATRAAERHERRQQQPR